MDTPSSPAVVALVNDRGIGARFFFLPLSIARTPAGPSSPLPPPIFSRGFNVLARRRPPFRPCPSFLCRFKARNTLVWPLLFAQGTASMLLSLCWPPPFPRFHPSFAPLEHSYKRHLFFSRFLFSLPCSSRVIPTNLLLPCPPHLPTYTMHTTPKSLMVLLLPLCF